MLSTRFALQYVLARQHPSTSEADLDHFYAAAHQLGAEHAPMALLAGKLTYNAAGQLEKLQQPTLIIWGAYELTGSRRITGQHGVSRHVQVELLQNAGLAVHEEHPDAVVETILRRSQEKQLERTQPDISNPIQAERGASNPVGAQSIESSRPVAPSPTEESQSSQVQEPEPVEAAEQEVTSNPLPQAQEPEHTAAEQEQAVPLVVEAYCVKCKRKNEVRDAHEVTMKNGRIAIRGTCAVCGTNLHRMGRLVSEP